MKSYTNGLMNIELIRNKIRGTLEANKRDKAIEKANRNNVRSNKYYGSKYWKNLRNEYIAEHPICENCEHYGIITPADEVHHIRRFESGKSEYEKWHLLLDKSNLRSLCSSCHNEYHRQMREQHINQIDYIMPTKLQSQLFELD